ncbi:MAG: bifunctional fructose-bisphosphatase/inositol-phosphate phosphatase [Methanomicrobiales archaeon]|jgi:myo-inositol-1(or 4)-monophosphatase|nr:bifunctional fructose-bisphosphatase/inositol-phosphate phosphatase [Methanomicrobiales archaeon]
MFQTVNKYTVRLNQSAHLCRSMDFFAYCTKISHEIAIAIDPYIGSKDGGKNVGMGADGTPTTFLDKLAEEIVLKNLHELEANVIVISEEAGIVEITPGAQDIIYLDPLDGTFNAIANIPIYSLSMAYCSEGKLTKGFVSNLATGEIFMAEKGKGATKDGKPIIPSSVSNLRDASCALYINLKDSKLDRFLPIISSVRRTRHLGSSALELAYVAAGSLDAYVDTRNRVRIIDVAAGILLCEEAGGVVSAPHGAPLSLPDSIQTGISLIASNSHLYEKILSLINQKNGEK